MYSSCREQGWSQWPGPSQHVIHQTPNSQQGPACLHLPVSTNHLEPYFSPAQNLPCSEAPPSCSSSSPLAPLSIFQRTSDYSCPQLSCLEGKKPLTILIHHQLLRFLLRVFPTPCLGACGERCSGKPSSPPMAAHQEGGKREQKTEGDREELEFPET